MSLEEVEGKKAVTDAALAECEPLPAVVLAAGYSRRMGCCKLTLPFNGEPVLRRVVRAALDAGLSPVLVTVRPDASPALSDALSGFDSRVIPVPAPEARFGQSESLKAGIRCLISLFRPDVVSGACPGGLSFPSSLPPGVMVLLGDQPLVGAELVRKLADFYREETESAAAPVCKGRRGNPVVLPARAFAEVAKLTGDEGARRILGAFGLRLMPTNDTAALTDVDTWEAYAGLPRTSLCKEASMSQSASEQEPHFVTPQLRCGKNYENPVIPDLPALWSLDHSESAPIPDEAACRELWTRYGMFSHIERHSELVADMAEALARRAVEVGATAHPELVALCRASGLLHDIAKSYTVQYGGSHAQIGASWVIETTGNHKIAQAVYHHVAWPWHLPEDLVHPVFFVIYADKRTRHDERVSLDERHEDLLVRYGKTEQSRAAIRRGWEHSKTIERVLSAQLEFPLHESTVVGGRLVYRA